MSGEPAPMCRARKGTPHMSDKEFSKDRSVFKHSIMDDVEPVKRSVSAAALLAARTGQPQPAPEPKQKKKS